jgi:hypothetical protein
MVLMRVLLEFGLALERWIEGVEGFEFTLGEGDARRLMESAVAGLDELQNGGGGLGCDRGESHQALGGLDLAVLEFEAVGFEDAEELLDIP